MSYQHTYSSYVNHVLNRSPSKTTYSFSKAERFPNMINQDIMDTESRQNYFQDRKSSEKQRRATIKPQKGPSSQLEKIIREIQQRKSKSKSPHKSPQKLTNHGEYSRKLPTQSSPTKGIRKNKSKSKSKSPSHKYRQTLYHNNPWNSGSKSREKQRSPHIKPLSPNRSSSYYEQMKKINHPSLNMTINGYYPVGTQISPTGRYASSRIPNVVGIKFNFSPSKRKNFSQSQTTLLGPGKYPVFSQFGPL